MAVVRVGHVGVGMALWFMRVRVAVCAGRHGLVRMAVVPVIVVVGVLVCQGLVGMLVPVRLG